MLTNKQIENVKIMMVKTGLNQQKLARRIRCSNGALSQIFNQTKEFPNIERRLLGWYNNPTRDINKEERELRNDKSKNN